MPSLSNGTLQTTYPFLKYSVNVVGENIVMSLFSTLFIANDRLLCTSLTTHILSPPYSTALAGTYLFANSSLYLSQSMTTVCIIFPIVCELYSVSYLLIPESSFTDTASSCGTIFKFSTISSFETRPI